MLKNPPHHCTCKAEEVPASNRIIKPLWQEANPAQKASAGPHRLIFVSSVATAWTHLTLHVTLDSLVRLGRLTGVVLASV